MAEQLRLTVFRSLSAAFAMTVVVALSSAVAFAAPHEPEGALARRLPADVLCWPLSAHDAASAEQEHDGACAPKAANGARPIDLKVPFRQVDIDRVTQLNLILRALSSAPSSGVFDFDAVSGAWESLSKADLLLLKATGRGAAPGGVMRPVGEEGRRVAGIRDFGTGDQGEWVLRPEVPAYLANQAAALRIATQSVRELRGDNDEVVADDEALGFSVWTKAVGRDNELNGAAFSSQAAMTLIHAGIDYGRGSFIDGSDGVHFGLMATYGDAAIAARASNNTAEASGKVTAARVGAYASWQAGGRDRLGAFVDSWVGLTVFDNTVIGDDLPTESYFSSAWAGAIEAGYGLHPFDTQLRVEPRMQVLYAQYDQPGHREMNGTAIAGAASGLSVRVGAKVDQEFRFDSRILLKPFAELNWRHDFASSETAFDGTSMSAPTPNDRMEFSVGVDANLDSKWTLGLVLQTPQAITDYRGVEALVSLKCDW